MVTKGGFLMLNYSRMGIYVFHDVDGIVDTYIEYFLKNIYKDFKKLLLVVNGKIEEMSKCRLEKYVSHVYIRENYGYDAGAYKDVFLNVIKENELQEYDEIVLMNNTFFGPFYAFNKIWNKFGEDVDFWGLSRYTGGKGEGDFPSHIQSYFIAIRKKLFLSRNFKLFWEEMSYPESFWDAVKEFEVKFTVYFQNLGFKSKSIIDEWLINEKISENINPSLSYAYSLIKEAKCPILKKKALGIDSVNYIESLQAIKYIEDNKFYDVNYIWESLYRNTISSAFNYGELEKFFYSHSRIYIYGAGKFGKAVESYFRYKGWKFEGFFVSNLKEDIDENIFVYDKNKIRKSDGIILALGKKNIEEVIDKIQLDLTEEQLFIPKY